MMSVLVPADFLGGRVGELMRQASSLLTLTSIEAALPENKI
jgi:hypothetical protein